MRKHGLFLPVIILTSGLFFDGSAQAREIPFYHYDPGTNQDLNIESSSSGVFVRGNPIQINMAETYAVERQAVVAGYDSVTEAWNAVLNQPAEERRHAGKIFNNAGWVRGVKNINGKWGAYLWTLQNRISFRTSETRLWNTGKRGQLPIANVIVGSLGNFPAMTNAVDIGPDISPATNSPPRENGDEGIFQVDLSNIFYQLSAPDIIIAPHEAVAAASATNRVRFEITGTNIPGGATWQLIPFPLIGGAMICPDSNWRFKDIIIGGLATSYTIRATSADNTNFFDEAKLAVVKIDISASQIYAGGNNITNLHLTPDSSPDARWEIIPFLPDGARIRGSAAGTNIVIDTGAIPTNYTVKAYAVKLTNCFDVCTATVLKADMIPDFNRNRVIDHYDTNHAASAPFRFWINDDADNGDMSKGDSDVPGHMAGRFGRANYADEHVNGRSDLLDFFPVWLDLQPSLLLLPPAGGVQYKLRQDDAALKAVYTDLTKNGAGSYMTMEEKTFGPAFKQNVWKASTFEITAAGVVLSEKFLEKIRSNGTKGILLLEGTRPTKKPLVLEVWKDKQKICAKELPLSIDGVEKMYRWINLRGAADGGISRETDIDEPPNYPDALSNRKQFIFVHGYNVSEEGARAWNAEMFKRLYQSGSRAMFTAVTWLGNDGQLLAETLRRFGGGPTPDYYRNVVNAFATAPHLAAAVDSLPGQKYIAGHSLGNMLVSSAINDHGLRVKTYFLLNAAVALEAFNVRAIHREQMRYPAWRDYRNRLWASDWHRLFDENDGRHDLTWRGRFAGISNLVYNYYSSTEDVLDNGDGQLHWPLATHWAWYNQEIYKGTAAHRISFSNREGGWGFNRSYVISPEIANRLTEDQIRTNSFFLLFDERGLYGANGNEVARRPPVRQQLLADAIPALSNPTGRNALDNIANRNRDLAAFRRGSHADDNWPDPDDRWRHSHIIEIAYPFNLMAFDSIVTEGGLE